MTASVEATELLNAAERRALEAAACRIIPADRDPGAGDLGCITQIIAGLARSPERLALYRAGIAGLDASADAYGGELFADLAPEQQDGILQSFQKNEPPAGAWSGATAQAFFRQLRMDVVEAYYLDPRTWAATGYPGPSLPLGYRDGGPCGEDAREVLR